MRLSLTAFAVPHAYKAGDKNQTVRHPSGNGKVMHWHAIPPFQCLADKLQQPLIDYDLSRRYPDTWQAMEKLVDSGKARSIGKWTWT